MKHDERIEKTFDAVKNLGKTEAPKSLYAGVMDKLQHGEDQKHPMTVYLKWAAIGLLILVNMVSYVSFQSESNVSEDALSYQVSDFVSDYELDDYDLSDYY